MREGFNNRERAEEERQEINIADVEEARDFIRDAVEKGEKPIVTVLKEYAEAAKHGLKPRSSWIGQPILAGTLGREPFGLKGEDRVAFEVETEPDYLEPRFTGPDQHFHGVVVFRGPIEPEAMSQVAV